MRRPRNFTFRLANKPDDDSPHCMLRLFALFIPPFCDNAHGSVALTAQCAFYPGGQTQLHPTCAFLTFAQKRSTFGHTKLFIAWSSSSVISASQSNSSYSSRLSKIEINCRRSADRNT